MSILLLISGLLLFVGLVVVHEFGHFIAARRNGVDVEEFGIFFPPRVWSKKMKGGYTFSINALPLGGFVRLKGEHDADMGAGTFGAAKTKAKMKIMLAGVAMNLIAAFIILTFAGLAGIPQLVDRQFTVARDTKIVKQEVLIGYVEPGSPADKIGLQARDHLLSLSANGRTELINNVEEFPNLTKQHAGQAVALTFMRGNTTQTVVATLRGSGEVEATRNTNEPKGYLGVVPTQYVLQRSSWSAPIVAGGLIVQFTELTFKGLGNIVANLFRGNATEASQQVSGPVGIFVILKDGSLLGYQFVLMIIAVISLTLAIMNVLPIPALDGGRMFVTLLFRALKKPLKQRTEELIHGAGFATLMALFILITIVDVRRFF